MVSFNVLTEPWIPALDRQGCVKEYGIVELLAKSPELLEIKDPSPLFQYGMYRLLITFITDIYRPDALEDIGCLLEQGCFDMDQVQHYVADKFVRFDLFDTEYPFLQVKAQREYEIEKAKKSVANLLPEIPTGNNDLLFVHALEGEHAISSVVCAKALCTIGLFCTAGVQGYPSGVNGAPPWFVLVRGKNLFETLVFNTWVPSLELPHYDDNVIWMSKRFVEPTKNISEISYVEGLMWPTRRVLLIPDASGGLCTYTGRKSGILVRHIYYQQGLNFHSYSLWHDPHTSAFTNKDGRGTLKPKPLKPLWRDIGSILLLQSYKGEKKEIFRPPIVNQYYKLEDNRYIEPRKDLNIETYGLATDNAKFLTWQYDRLSVSAAIAESTGKGQKLAWFVQNCIEKGEEASSLLKGVVKKLYTDRNKGKAMDSLAERAEAYFWAEMRGIFFGEFIALLEKAAVDDSPDWRENPLVFWNDKVRSTAMRTLDGSLEQMGNHADVLRSGVTARSKLNVELRKILR
jgi:CRISPR system Cascade subunit CasA